MNSSAPLASRPVKLIVILASCLAVLAIGGFGAWWLGPWSQVYRFQHSSLVDLRHVVDQDPNNQKAWREIGLRLARDGDPLAEPALRHAYSLDPSDKEVGTGLGELLMSTGRLPEAFQILKAVATRHPNYALGHMALGRLYRKKASYLHASQEFEAVVAIDQNFSDAWHSLAVCYLEMQQAAKAQNAIDRALKLAPDEPEYLAMKASIEAAVGHVDAGISAAKRAAQLAPKSVKMQANLAIILLAHQRGEPDLRDAELAISKIEQLDPKYPLLLYQRGELERLRGHWDQAARYLERAVSVSPGQDEVFFALGQTFRRLGRNADADKALGIYHRRQELRRRIEAVQITLGGRPNDAGLYTQLAWLQLQTGDRSAAISSLHAAREIDPNSPNVIKGLRALGETSTGTAPKQ